jgi:hypothetical protein
VFCVGMVLTDPCPGGMSTSPANRFHDKFYSFQEKQSFQGIHNIEDTSYSLHRIYEVHIM